MKMTKQIALAGLVVLAGLAAARADETNLTFSVNQTVPDANANGLTLSENLNLGSGVISEVKVSLDITGGYNGDLYAYLVGPNGGFAVLLNRVGVGYTSNPFGYSDAGFDVVLSDTAANGSIHTYQSVTTAAGGLLSGTWQPDGLNLDPKSGVSAFQSASQSALLSSLIGSSADGSWTLFIADLSSGGVSKVVSWGLDVTIVPEPQTWAIVGLAGLVSCWRRRRPV